MKKYLLEVENALSAFPKRTSILIPESYIGGGKSKLTFAGIRVPHLHQAMKKGFTFSNLESRKQAEIWDYIWWNSNCFEVMSLSLNWYSDTLAENHKSFWPILKKWSRKIDNWAHADGLSGIIARLLEVNPDRIYPTLLAWNRSKNMWLRRLSLVSLIYYSSQRDSILPLNKILPMISPQLKINDYYLQKGIGWTLRETYNVYPNQTYKFIEKNVLDINPWAFSAATEKMSTQQKSQLKKLRKRKNSSIV